MCYSFSLVFFAVLFVLVGGGCLFLLLFLHKFIGGGVVKILRLYGVSVDETLSQITQLMLVNLQMVITTYH